LLEVRAVVNYLVLAAQRRVLVLNGIEAVRAGRHDFLDAVAVHRGDVLHGLHLKQKLVAGALGGVTGAAFFEAQHRVVGAHVLQNAGKRARHALVAVVESPG
nr:hypothetical protein [Tanacetum cinerariifolium]